MLRRSTLPEHTPRSPQSLRIKVRQFAGKRYRQHEQFRIIHAPNSCLDLGKSGPAEIPSRHLEFRRQSILRKAGLCPESPNLRPNDVLCSSRHLLRFRSLTLTDSVRMIAPISEQDESTFVSTHEPGTGAILASLT